MRVSRIILSLVVLFAGQFSTAQQLVFKTYSVQDGLVANPIRKIFQDSKGFIWAITWDGLSRYDGYRFRNFTTANGLSFNLINDLYELPDGSLVVANNNESLDLIKPGNIVVPAISRGVTVNRFLTTNTGQVLAATDHQAIYQLKDNKLIRPPQSTLDGTYTSLAQIDHNTFVGVQLGRLHFYDSKLNIIQVIQEPGTEFRAVYADSRKRCWVGTDAGLRMLEINYTAGPGRKFSLVKSPFDIKLPGKTAFNCFLEESDTSIWIGTDRGLVIIDRGGNVVRIKEDNGLPANQINYIFKDKENNIWLGTNIGIIKHVTKNKIRTYSTNPYTQSDHINILTPLSRDRVLIATTNGLIQFHIPDLRFELIGSGNKYAGFTNTVGNQPDPLLVSSAYPVMGRYDKFQNKFQTSPSRQFVAAVQDHAGNLVSSDHSGVWIYSGGREYRIPNFNFRINNLVLDHKGGLWIGTWQNGLYRATYSITGDSVSVEVKDMSHLISGKEIRSLFEDSKDQVWVGTRYAGLNLITETKNGYVLKKKWDRQTGLMTDWVSNITEDGRGNIWVGSNQGIDKLVKWNTDYQVFNFSRQNNFFEVTNTILPLDDNLVLVGTGSGLVLFEDDQTENQPAPPVILTSVKLGREKKEPAPDPEDQEVGLHYRDNQAVFEFSSPSYANEKQVLYTYRLSGSEDSSWSNPSNDHSISYASLQPGKYRFEVKSLGWNQTESHVTGFDFEIRPPFWRTAWFIIPAAMVLAALLYFLYRYRVNQLLKLQKIRNRIAADLHDDIGSTLTNISLLSELSNKNIGEPGKAREFLQRISEEVGQSSQALDDIVWSINARNDSLEEVAARMRRYAAEVFEGADIQYSLVMEDQFASRKLNMEQRRDVFLVFKEVINNIYKHSGARNVKIELFVEHNKLHIDVADDGKGFDRKFQHNRNGIRNMETRVKRWNGKMDINTSPGKGTHMSIALPME